MVLGAAFPPPLEVTQLANRPCKAPFLLSPVADITIYGVAEVEWEARPRLAFKTKYLPLNLGANTSGTNPQAED